MNILDSFKISKILSKKCFNGSHFCLMEELSGVGWEGNMPSSRQGSLSQDKSKGTNKPNKLILTSNIANTHTMTDYLITLLSFHRVLSLRVRVHSALSSWTY